MTNLKGLPPALFFGGLVVAMVCQANAVGMPIISATKLQCEGLETPRAIEKTQPNFSWICESSDPAVRAQIQTAHQIMVADSPAALTKDQGKLWDSGKVKGDQSTFVTYGGRPLTAHQECFWKVRLWNRDDVASPWSQPASWSMGFLPSAPWKPTWITGARRTDLLRKDFTVTKSVKRAWVYASALGLYELRLNGSKVGSDLFAPGWTDYRKRVQYRRFDVTDQVRSGANVIGAELAPGWFAGRIAWYSNNRYGKTMAIAAELHLEFADGSTQIVATNGGWKTSAGPLIASDIQNGDQYDAPLEQAGWDMPGFDDASWATAEVMPDENRNMVAKGDQPVGVIREMKPVTMTEPITGVYVYDLSQNITGVARVTVKGAKGTTITLRHAERLNADGTLDVTNLKEAKATDTYILRGNGAETFQPKFTFHGFRWVSVEGLAKAPALADVTGNRLLNLRLRGYLKPAPACLHRFNRALLADEFPFSIKAPRRAGRPASSAGRWGSRRTPPVQPSPIAIRRFLRRELSIDEIRLLE